MTDLHLIPHRRQRRVTEARVRVLVADFLAFALNQSEHSTFHVDWKRVSEAEDMGYGQGFCRDASVDLSNYLQLRGVEAYVITHHDASCLPYPGKYPDDPRHETFYHCVVEIPYDDPGAWVVDLTARQFDVKLPFPYIFSTVEHAPSDEEDG